MSKKIFCLVYITITCMVTIEFVSDHLKSQGAVWASPELHPNVTICIPTVQCAGHVASMCPAEVPGCSVGLAGGLGGVWPGPGSRLRVRAVAGHNTRSISSNHPHVTAPRDWMYITSLDKLSGTETVMCCSNLKSQSNVGWVIPLSATFCKLVSY